MLPMLSVTLVTQVFLAARSATVATPRWPLPVEATVNVQVFTVVEHVVFVVCGR